MLEGSSSDITFVSAPRVTVVVFKTPGGAETKGKVTSRYKQPCSLCTDPLERDIEIEANFYFREKSKRDQTKHGLEAEDVDDVNFYYYENDHINLGEVAEEALILSLSRYWHPPKDENDNCVVCGINPRKDQPVSTELSKNLGNLLKDAGIKTGKRNQNGVLKK